MLSGISTRDRKGRNSDPHWKQRGRKTTALRVISGLKTPDAGEIRFKEKRIEGLSPAEIVKMGISHVPQGEMALPLYVRSRT